MRVLLSTTSGAGHFRPLLPLARALEAAGHHVACAAPVEAKAMVEREGLSHLPFDGVPFDHPDRGPVLAQLPVLPTLEANRLFCREIFGRLNTTYGLPGAQQAVATFAPDLVLHEFAELSVQIAAEARGVPSVAVHPSLALEVIGRSLAEGVAGLRAGLGLPGDDAGEALLASEGVSWFPSLFDHPDAAAHLHRFRDPGLPAPSDPSGRDLVYVTLGSEAHSLPFFAPALRACVAGALVSGLPVVVSTGCDLDDDVLGGLSGDLTVRRWVDQADVLRRARVVVCHAGAGTTLGALAAQVPIVAVPLFADQPHNAARVVATGCGLQVPPDADQVGAAVEELVAGGVPAGSVDVARAVAALPPATEAVPWLEALAAP